MKTVGIDIDGTLRDLDDKIDEYLYIDHKKKFELWKQNPAVWDRLNKAFDGDQETVRDWLYGNRAFHIFGQAPKMYKAAMDHVNAIAKRARANGGIEVYISSVQREQSIIATLFWLSKTGCKVSNIKFFETHEE